MEKSTKIGLGIFALIILGGFFFIESTPTITGNTISEGVDVREITLDAERFEFSKPVIEVNKGERIRIKVNNIDTIHGIYIPELGVNGREEVEFTADKVGEFPFNCAVMCGPGHHSMGGKIVVK
jgi:cytochrome c oxidase subunit II